MFKEADQGVLLGGNTAGESRCCSHGLPSVEPRTVQRPDGPVRGEVPGSEDPSAHIHRGTVETTGALSGTTEPVQDVGVGDIGVRVASGGVRPIDHAEPIEVAENVRDMKVAVADAISVRQALEDVQRETSQIRRDVVRGLDPVAKVVLERRQASTARLYRVDPRVAYGERSRDASDRPRPRPKSGGESFAFYSFDDQPRPSVELDYIQESRRDIRMSRQST